MNEAPRIIYIGFIGDDCAGAFVSLQAAQDGVRDKTYSRMAHMSKTLGKFYLIWSDLTDNHMYTLHVSDDGGTHQHVVARIERVQLERRAPGDRRR